MAGQDPPTGCDCRSTRPHACRCPWAPGFPVSSTISSNRCILDPRETPACPAPSSCCFRPRWRSPPAAPLIRHPRPPRMQSLRRPRRQRRRRRRPRTQRPRPQPPRSKRCCCPTTPSRAPRRAWAPRTWSRANSTARRARPSRAGCCIRTTRCAGSTCSSTRPASIPPRCGSMPSAVPGSAPTASASA